MARRKGLWFKVALVGAVVVTLAVGTVLVVEDMIGVPYEVPPAAQPDLTEITRLLSQDFVFDTVVDILNRHPDWAEAIANYIMDNFDMSKLTREDLELLCQMFPQLQEYIGAFLLDQLTKEGELPKPLEEPQLSGGLPDSVIDNGNINPALLAMTLFTVDSTYNGTVYLRSCSWGDYDPENRKFLNAPDDFNGELYMASPSLFPGFEAQDAGQMQHSITFHLASHRDYGTLVPDVPVDYYVVDTSGTRKEMAFDTFAENRLRLIDEDNYTVSFFPHLDASLLRLDDSGASRKVYEDEMRYRRYVRAHYKAVPEEQQDALQEFLVEHNLRTPDQVVGYLKNNYEYSFQSMDCADGEDIVLDFLNVTKAGTCTNFASAATLLIRQLGIPCRFVSGYMAQVRNKTGNEIKGINAHAWIEVYVEGFGWRRMEPTAAMQTKNVEPSASMPPSGEVEVPYSTNSDTKFTVETSYDGELYFTDFVFGDYQPETRTFSDTVSGEPPIDAKSMFMPATIFERAGMDAYAITIHREEDFQGQSMIHADYSGSMYSTDTTMDAYSFRGEEGFAMVGDQRLLRTGLLDYTHLFYPEADLSSMYYTLSDSAYYSFVRNNYIAVPSALEDVINDYIDQEGISSIEDIRENFRRYHYLKNGLVTGGDPIAELLSGSHEGTTKTFIAATVLLCRRLGIPARYVEGYYSPSSYQTTRRISQANFRAWAEVYVQGKGWQRVPLELNGKVDRVDTVFQAHLQDVEYTYDGEPHSATLETAIDNLDALNNVLLPGDRAVVTFSKSSQNVVNAGKYRIRANIAFYDHWGEDVTSRYPNITIEGSNNLVINKRQMTFQTNQASLLVNTSDLQNEVSCYNLLPGHYVDETQLDWAPIPFATVGTYEHVVDIHTIHIYDYEGNEVTENYAIGTVWGKVIISAED